MVPIVSPRNLEAPRRLVRFCGADCGHCDTYRLFLAGDASGLVNRETGYRCCWLPAHYREGRDCPIKTCAEQHGVAYCGACSQFDQCERMQAFYAQPGYDALRERMLQAVHRMAEGLHRVRNTDPD